MVAVTILRASPKQVAPLSARELEVLALVATGLTNKEIAAALTVSRSTVKTHLEHILQKLQATDRTQAAVTALTHGLLLPAG